MNDTFAEQLLAVLRLGPFLAREHPKVTKAMHAEAIRLPKLFRQELRAFFDEDPPEKPPKLPSFDYLKVLEQVSKPVDQHDLESMIDAHQEPQDALDVMMPLTRALAYLNGVAVRRVKQTLTGVIQLVPSDQEVERFRRAYTVVDEPITVLQKLRRLSLLEDEVVALTSVYPGLYEMISKMAGDELAAAKARKGAKWNIPIGKERQLMMLLQMSPSDATLVKDMQATYGQEQDEKDQQAAPKPSRIDLKSESHQTTAQKTEAGGR